MRVMEEQYQTAIEFTTHLLNFVHDMGSGVMEKPSSSPGVHSATFSGEALRAKLLDDNERSFTADVPQTESLLFFGKTSDRYKKISASVMGLLGRGTSSSSPDNDDESVGRGGSAAEREVDDQVRHLRPRAAALMPVERYLTFLLFFTGQLKSVNDGGEIRENMHSYRAHVSVEDVDRSNSSSSSGRRSFVGPPSNKKSRTSSTVTAAGTISSFFNQSFNGRNNSTFNTTISSGGDDDRGEVVSATKATAFGYQPVREGHKVVVSFWCMNPAVAFRNAFDECRSIVLASGTLCPTETFVTELGVNFDKRMEGNHVVAEENLFAVVLPRGPSGHPLRATFENTQSGGVFTAELCRLITSVCYTVPGGVLCFFPSYRLMNDVDDFLRRSRLIQKIEQRKKVFSEPKRSSDLAHLLSDYETVIKYPKNEGMNIDGALLFAVCRGKVSEGVDFTDDLARCVITVGIPFPSTKDPQVMEKKRYNTANASTLGLLTGDHWYSTQAYRALNQALGRCIRHKNDWGALILVDERLVQQGIIGRQLTQQQQYQNGANLNPVRKISKWITQRLQVCNTYAEFEKGLTEFVHKMTDKAKEEKDVVVIRRF